MQEGILKNGRQYRSHPVYYIFLYYFLLYLSDVLILGFPEQNPYIMEFSQLVTADSAD